MIGSNINYCNFKVDDDPIPKLMNLSLSLSLSLSLFYILLINDIISYVMLLSLIMLWTSDLSLFGLHSTQDNIWLP